MAITLTANYQETLKPETVALIDELCGDDGEYGLPCALEFIDEYGEENFAEYYTLYVDQGEELEYGIVDAFVSEFGFEKLHRIEDAYAGEYDSGAEFAQIQADDEGIYIPSWVEVDWEESWENLQSDYDVVEFEGCKYFFRRWY